MSVSFDAANISSNFREGAQHFTTLVPMECCFSCSTAQKTPWEFFYPTGSTVQEASAASRKKVVLTCESTCEDDDFTAISSEMG